MREKWCVLTFPPVCMSVCLCVCASLDGRQDAFEYVCFSFFLSTCARIHTLGRHAVHSYLILRQNIQTLGERTVTVVTYLKSLHLGCSYWWRVSPWLPKLARIANTTLFSRCSSPSFQWCLTENKCVNMCKILHRITSRWRYVKHYRLGYDGHW